MSETIPILPGRFRHYKGNEYTVIGTARHSETEEEFVVYRQKYGEYSLWVRPKAMFAEKVTVDGQVKPRFERLTPSPESARESAENFFANIPPQLPSEIIQTLIQAVGVRIERIISQGHTSGSGFWYDQPQHEWVIVLKGAARLQFEDRVIEMNPGDFINIPAHTKHRVDWTTPDEATVWLGIHYGHSV